MKFKTDFIYQDRKSKARYVYLKYKPILKGRILDVGADACYLKKYLDKKADYIGIGLGAKVDKRIDLEKKKIPFAKKSFDCVLCLDVLEHLDNIHQVFDQICRLSKKYVIISLPNAHRAFFGYLKNGNYKKNQHIKFYGLPAEKPPDRHRWFFSTKEAKRFIRFRAKKNKMAILQLDIERSGQLKINFFQQLIFKVFLSKYYKILSNQNLYQGTLWVVLQKQT